MAGYTRQSVANIINGSKITAPPLNAEFNKIQDAFNGVSGHTHDGTTGNAAKIPLPTSVVGYLPVANGGVGGKNNTTSTADPTTADDTTQGYAPGSIWINATTGYAHICLHNTENAAYWAPLVAVSNTNVIAPKLTNTVDIGTSTLQFKDIHIDGTGYIDAVSGETVSTTGDVTIGGALTVTGTSTIGDITTSNIDIDGGSIDGTPIGAGTASTGSFDGLTVIGNVTFATATVASLGTVSSADIDGGTIDGVTLGTNSPVTDARIDNIKIDGNAITSTNANGSIAITPDGTGTVDISKANISGGTIGGTTTIDGVVIGGTTPSTGSFTTLAASTSITGTLTGDVVGDIYASDTTSKVLESGTNGTDATFTGAVSGDVTSTGTSSFATLTVGTALSFDAGATATITNLIAPTNNGDAATKGYVDTAVSNLVDNADSALDTLNELASALDNDASFSTTVTNSLATKLPLSGGVMTGNITMTDTNNAQHSIVGLADPITAQGAATKAYADTKLPLSGGTMSGAIAMGTSKITGLGTPTATTDAVTKQYVDDQINSGIEAGVSASAASSSASSASSSESNALIHANAAASSYDSFDDRYLGAKSSVPTTDNDGDSLIVGALYFDTNNNAMKVYSGSGGWIEAGSTVNGVLDKFRYVSTASQTTFSGTDANGSTLAYDPNFVDVYLAGLRLVSGTDYTATSGTSIQLTSAPDTGSIVEIVAFGNVVINDPKDITADRLHLDAVSKVLDAGIVRDLFVYDTSKDSDGGAWRNNTQSTSWYNETLNTTTRGSTKNFPSVAVISVTIGGLKIYDATESDVPLWMEFDGIPGGSASVPNEDIYTVTARDGKVIFGSSAPAMGTEHLYNGFWTLDFVKDETTRLYTNKTRKPGGLSERNTSTTFIEYSSSGLPTGYTDFVDVSVTVMPNAPIDEETGLPELTIVGADYGSGVAIVHNDGTINTISEGSNEHFYKVGFTEKNELWALYRFSPSDYSTIIYIPTLPKTDTAYSDHTEKYDKDSSVNISGPYYNRTPDHNVPNISNHGLAAAVTENSNHLGLLHRSADGNMACLIDTNANTGWMPSDTKVAIFNTKDTSTLGAVTTDLISNGDFSAEIDLWGTKYGGSMLQPAGPIVQSQNTVPVTKTATGGSIQQLTSNYGFFNAFQNSDGSSQSARLEKDLSVNAGQTYYLQIRWKPGYSNTTTKAFSVDYEFVEKNNPSNVVVSDTNNSRSVSVGTSLIDYNYITIPANYTGGDVWLKITVTSSSAGRVDLDEIAMWDQSDYVVNGNHDGGDSATPSSSDKLSGITAAGTLKLFYSGNNYLRQTVNVDPDTIYVLTFDLLDRYASNSLSAVKVDSTHIGNWLTGDFQIGANSLTFKTDSNVSSVNLKFEMYNASNGFFEIDNITLKKAHVENRASGISLPFNAATQLPQNAPVSSGSELVALRQATGTGEQALNIDTGDLIQSKNATLQNGIGIGKDSGAYSIMAWAKQGDSETTVSGIIASFCENGDYNGTQKIEFRVGQMPSGNSKMSVEVRDSVSFNLATQSASSFAMDKEWHHYCWTTSGNGVFKVYRDGKSMGTISPLTARFPDTSTIPNLQLRASLNGLSGGRSLFKVCLSEVSEKALEKIVKDESGLLGANSNALLYGTSDAITGIAYDYGTETLLVGTSSGRSEFKRLNRIDNTTDAVSNTISAYNGLVAED